MIDDLRAGGGGREKEEGAATTVTVINVIVLLSNTEGCSNPEWKAVGEKINVGERCVV